MCSYCPCLWRNYYRQRKTKGEVSRIPWVLRHGDTVARQYSVAESAAMCKGFRAVLWPTLLSHEDCDHSGRVKRCADYLASLEMKAYFIFLTIILESFSQFNTIFQADATQIAIFLSEMNRLLHVFMAKFVIMRMIKSAEDRWQCRLLTEVNNLTTVSW